MSDRRSASVTSSAERGGIAVVVVTHASESTIDDCLMRLRVAHGVDEIRVVDNASSDGTMEIVQRHALQDARLRFIANPDNPGFAVGCNQGARDSQSPWLAFVNPDLMVEPDTLTRLRAHAASVNGDALLGVDLVDEDGVRDAAARRRDPVFAEMLRAPARASRLGVPPDDTLLLQPVDAISGALMLLPRTLFERLNGLDEGYRLHAEDMDLCRRARQAGALVAVANDIRVLHIRGVSSRARPVFVEWHKHRGLWRYFRTFEAAQCGLVTRLSVFGAIWLHFGAVLARLLLRRR
jgi:GT2 family glycosyltransferase